MIAGGKQAQACAAPGMICDNVSTLKGSRLNVEVCDPFRVGILSHL